MMYILIHFHIVGLKIYIVVAVRSGRYWNFHGKKSHPIHLDNEKYASTENSVWVLT